MTLLHFLTTALLLTTTLASIADLQAQLPKCSLDCLAKGAAEHGCRAQDIACQCSKMEAMIKTVSPCLVKAGCELQDITNTAKVVSQICEEETGTSNATEIDATASKNAATPTSTVMGSTETPGAAPHILHSSAWAGAVVAVAAAVLL
ncbi:Fc.00g101730.m01.CDS01 [Cosmosporella sp. VM-42]